MNNNKLILTRTAFWFAVLLTGIFTTVYLSMNPVEDHGDEHIREYPRMLFNFTVNDLSAVEIIMKGELHRVEKNTSGVWYLHGISAHVTGTDSGHEHQVMKASPSPQIASALGLLSRAQADRQINNNVANLENYGLAQPEIIVLFYSSQDESPLAILHGGNLVPSKLGWYVRLVNEDEVVLTSSYHLNNLRELLVSLDKMEDSL